MSSAIRIERSLDNSGLALLRALSARLGLRVRVDRYAATLAALSAVALGPMLQPGYFWGAHDARHAVYFLFEFDRVLRDGILYPRWFADMTYGYGYPLFNIYGPLAFYIGEFLHLLGADFVLAVKLVFGLAWIASGLAMYGLMKRVFANRAAGLLAGLLFVLMPYHLVDVYVRAAFAESVALVFIPLTLWAFYDTVTVGNRRSVLFAAFSYAGMVFAHNGIALLFSIVLAAWILFLLLRDERASGTPLLSPGAIPRLFRRALPTLGGLVLGLGLTGIFMLPLVAEYRYINVAQWTASYYSYQDHFIELFQLFSPVWGFGISNQGPVDGLSFQLGLVATVLALFALAGALRHPDARRGVLLFFAGLTLVVIVLMLEFSLPVWQAFGLASVAQFPWRLLTLTTASLSVLGGAVLLYESNPDEGPAAARFTRDASALIPLYSRGVNPPSVGRRPARGLGASSLSVIVLSLLAILGSWPYITAQNILEAKEGPVSIAGLMRFENSANEMTGTTVYADEQPRWSPLADNYIAGKNVRSKIDYSTVPDWLFIRIPRDGLKSNGERVDYNAPNGDVPIVFNVQMYPGWSAYLTEARSTQIVRKLDITTEPPYGRIKVTLPQGEHGVWLRFEDTPPRTAGTALTVVSLLLALGLAFWPRVASRIRRSARPRMPAPTPPQVFR